MATEYTLHAGDLATLDAFLCGLVPVKVLRIYYQTADEPRTQLVLDLKVTAARTGYTRGEVLRGIKAESVVHRRQVFTHNGHYRYRGQADFKLSEGMPRNNDGTLDQRYTVKGEQHTADCTRWAARFCGEWIGWSASKAGAETLARTHQEGN